MDKEKQAEVQAAQVEAFESGISQTGFGLFNYIVIFLAGMMSFAIIFATSVGSYILTAMQTDITLSITQKGLLNASPYWGMIFGALIWALLADCKGRRTVLIITHLLDVIFCNCAALSQTITFILLFKFCAGFCICGGYTTFIIYMSEVHEQKKRIRMLFVIGLMLTSASAVLPILAMPILPNYWRIDPLGLRYTSWQFYMTVTTIPSLIMGISFIFLPESPRFDINAGKSSKAHRTFRTIYHINTCKPADSFPLPPPTDADTYRKLNLLQELGKFRMVFRKEYAVYGLLLFSTDFCVFMIQNTTRLWQPTLIAAAESLKGVTDIDFCCLIENVVSATELAVQQEANRNETMTEVKPSGWRLNWTYYSNNLVFSAIDFVCIFAAFFFLNFFGPKIVLISAFTLTTILAAVLYFVSNYLVLAVPAFYLGVSHVGTISLISLAVHMFPTSVRATFMFTSVTLGRLSTTVGHVVMPKLMTIGCIPVILWIFIFSLASTIISIFLPNAAHLKLN
ncbi:synaptic vesicle glycoprotein 2B-like [Scaptodrosophila lebanonensis]|uniref:Synaptic vesicle glycoprotein 2B-like n=1 Tax=Drosophila lebanonensis TaxID=7225 RepID=A0A6J2UM54_DROLE|nr:synaptic vesicle glycoprotein 2B-like [Scaptodrosophila lebanonensis]